MEGHSARQRFWALLSRLTKAPIISLYFPVHHDLLADGEQC